MITFDQICSNSAEELFAQCSSSPLFEDLEHVAIRKLIHSSVCARVLGTESAILDYEILNKAFCDITLRHESKRYPGAKSCIMPALLTEGSLHYRYPADGLSKLPHYNATKQYSVHIMPHFTDRIDNHLKISLNPKSSIVVANPIMVGEIAMDHPQVLNLLLTSHRSLMADMLKWWHVDISATPVVRIARYLSILLPENALEHETLRISQNDLCTRLDYSRSTTTKALSALYNDEVISTGHKKILINTKKLRSFLSEQ